MNKLTYEDCLELKDAGFPQNKYREGTKGAGPVYFEYYPTLSELIEECGALSLFVLMKDHLGWSAGCGNDLLNGTKASGSSPEQAVKNLYIALNKK